MNGLATCLHDKQRNQVAREQLERQGEAIRAIQKAKVDLENEISLIIGTLDDSATYEAS